MAFEKELALTKEQAEEFYKEHEDKEYYDSLTNHMSRYAWLCISHNNWSYQLLANTNSSELYKFLVAG